MGKLTFKGGVHPFDGKKYTKVKPIEVLLPKGECVFPLSQHIGAPAVPVVKKGDYVLDGQLIAQANGETLRIEPWGKDSLRVRATMLPEFSGKDWALTEVPEKTEVTRT